MSDSHTPAPTIVCLASYFKGGEFIRECKRQNCRVILVTREKILHEDWPRESLDDIIALPNDANEDLFVYVVSQLARPQAIDRVIALEEFDVITAGLIREHLCMDGMTSVTARVFRDKLSMRVNASRAGIRVPDFVHVLNYDELRSFMERVPPPWVMKPRTDVSAIGIDALDARENLRERSPYYLLERFVSGEVFHVDSLVKDGKVLFAGVNRYGRPPMNVAHEGGVFITKTVTHNSNDQRDLLRLNRKLIARLGLVDGAAHAEFIKRVGGAYIAEALEASSGINIWREWARIEIARGREAYKLPATRKEYGGVVLSLSRQEYPDTSGYTEDEIVYRVKKRYHAGLVVRSAKSQRVDELTDDFARRFVEDFTAVVPLPERPE
jgi:hypothetical protein